MESEDRERVAVTWIDSSSHDTHWVSHADARDIRPVQIKTVGFLYNSSDNHMTIVSSIGEDGISGLICIPRNQILCTQYWD